jgi:hypothetical protein
MKTIQSLLLVTAVALLFLVGKYAAIYTGLVDSLRTDCHSVGLLKSDHLFEQVAAAVITLGQLWNTASRKVISQFGYNFSCLGQIN